MIKQNRILENYKNKARNFLHGAGGSVFQGMAKLAAGSAIARLIGFAAIPILTRLYEPADFGVLAIYSAAISLIAPILTLCYSQALPLCRQNGAALNLLTLTTAILIFNSLLITLILWATSEQLFALLSIEILLPWWWLIVLGGFAMACFDLLTYWATRSRDYKTISITAIWQSFAGSITKILFGLIGANPQGLIIGQIIAQSGGITKLSQPLFITLKRHKHQVRWKRIKLFARHYKQFPIYRLPSQALLVLSSQTPLIFASWIYQPEVTGQLSLALMALAMPANLLGQTTAKAFYAEAAQHGTKTPKLVHRILVDVLLKLSLIAAPIALIIFFTSKPIFPIIFGKEWSLAGDFASILSIYIFFQFLQKPVSYAFLIFNGQRTLLALNLQRLSLIAIIFTLAKWLSWGPIGTVTAYSIALGIHYALSTYYAFVFVKKKTK